MPDDKRPCECGEEATGYLLDPNAVSLYAELGHLAAFPVCGECREHRDGNPRWLSWGKGDILPFNWLTGEIHKEPSP